MKQVFSPSLFCWLWEVVRRFCVLRFKLFFPLRQFSCLIKSANLITGWLKQSTSCNRWTRVRPQNACPCSCLTASGSAIASDAITIATATSEVRATILSIDGWSHWAYESVAFETEGCQIIAAFTERKGFVSMHASIYRWNGARTSANRRLPASSRSCRRRTACIFHLWIISLPLHDTSTICRCIYILNVTAFHRGYRFNSGSKPLTSHFRSISSLIRDRFFNRNGVSSDNGRYKLVKCLLKQAIYYTNSAQLEFSLTVG